MKEAWFNCQVLDKYTEKGWFGGRKYFLVLKINDIYIKTKEVDETVYYRDIETITRLKMYSEDGKFWTFTP